MGFKWLLFGFLAVIVGGCSDSGSASDDDRPWRVLADKHLVGGPFEVGAMTATAPDQYHTMWAALGVESDEPAVDFDEEVVVAYTASYSSGCEYPFIDLEISDNPAAITARYAGSEPGVCAADENPYVVVLAVQRDALTGVDYLVDSEIWPDRENAGATLRP